MLSGCLVEKYLGRLAEHLHDRRELLRLVLP